MALDLAAVSAALKRNPSKDNSPKPYISTDWGLLSLSVCIKQAF